MLANIIQISYLKAKLIVAAILRIYEKIFLGKATGYFLYYLNVTAGRSWQRLRMNDSEKF